VLTPEKKVNGGKLGNMELLMYIGGQKYPKGFARTIFLSSMEIRCHCIYECGRVNIILFLRMATSGKKFILGL